MYDELNDIHLDVLREIGNIGSGNAAISLSALLNTPVTMQVPKIRILDFRETTEALGGPEKMIVGLLFTMSGDVKGMLMFLLQKEFAHMAIGTLLGKSPENFVNLDDMSLSAIQEVGNIMAGSYVNAIAAMTHLFINISIPGIAIDMAGAILSVPAIQHATIGDKIIFIEDEFASAEEAINSHVLMIPDIDSLKKVMGNLGIEV